MEIKFLASGLGASIPKLGVGFSLFSGLYIMFRATKTSSPYVLGIATGPQFGASGGTFIASHVDTSWAPLDSSKHAWVCDKSQLVGKLAEVSLKGTLVLKGKIDVDMNVYDDQREAKITLSKVNLASVGGQILDTKVRGKIVDMMNATRQGLGVCGHP